MKSDYRYTRLDVRFIPRSHVLCEVRLSCEKFSHTLTVIPYLKKKCFKRHFVQMSKLLLHEVITCIRVSCFIYIKS